MSKPMLKAALESIDFQKDTFLFDQLTLAFGRLKGVSHPADREVILHEIGGIIERRTNLKTRFFTDPRPYINAMATISAFTKDHPMMSDSYRNRLRGMSIQDLTEEKVMDAYVDMKNSKVGGYFSKVVSKITIFEGLLGDRFTPEEIAAVVLHEIGHVFTFFEMSSKLAVVNVVLSETANLFSNTNDRIIRKKFLTDVEDKTGHKFEDKDAMSDTESPETAVAIVSAAAIDWVRSELGYKYYDDRLSEFMADQFATRHGAGRHLVTALDKMNMATRKPVNEYLSTKATMRSNLVALLTSIVDLQMKNKFYFLPIPSSLSLNLNPLTIAASLVGNIMIRLAYITYKNYGEKGEGRYRYDSARDRYIAIRRELVTAIKDPVFDKEYVKDQLMSIKRIDEIIGSLNKYGNLTNKAADFLYDYLNGSFKELKFQRQYEELVNNELFVRAAQLKSIG